MSDNFSLFKIDDAQTSHNALSERLAYHLLYRRMMVLGSCLCTAPKFKWKLNFRGCWPCEILRKIPGCLPWWAGRFSATRLPRRPTPNLTTAVRLISRICTADFLADLCLLVLTTRGRPLIRRLTTDTHNNSIRNTLLQDIFRILDMSILMHAGTLSVSLARSAAVACVAVDVVAAAADTDIALPDQYLSAWALSR